MLSDRVRSSLDPYMAVIIAIIERAKKDAEKGDMWAVGWLLTDGIKLVKIIAPDDTDLILNFCVSILARVEREELMCIWNLGADIV